MSPSPEKRRRWTARRLLLIVVRVAVPSVPPHCPPSPPTLPSDTDPLCHLLELEEEDTKAPSSPLQRKILRAILVAVPFVSPLLFLHLLLPLLLHPPTSVLLYHPQQVDCCVFMFRPSPRAPFALRPLFRCAIYGVFGSLAFSSKRLIVISCVMCHGIGAVGL